MVLVTAVRDYITRMLSDIAGMKLRVISVAFSQSQLLQKEVFLVETIDSAAKETMTHLKAVCFLRPTGDNIQHLKRIISSPSFGEYHLFFSNILKTSYIQILGDADEHEVVQQVQEFYADFLAVDPYHFTLNISSNYIYMLPMVADPLSMQKICDRMVDGISSVFLALKKRPIIRYQRSSEISRRIAQETAAMVHELLGIKDNKVDLRGTIKVPKDQQELVLSSEQDAFFKANMFENFGDLGMNIKKMVDEFQQKAKSNQNFQTIEDMAKFVDHYPEYRKMHGNVSKHVTMVTEMSKIVDERKLMLVSQTEQDLACNNAGQLAAFEAVMNQLNNDSIADLDRLRLVLLYALRYEKDNPQQLEQLINKLASHRGKFPPGLVTFLLKQAGVDRRTGDLYGNRDLFNRARNMARGLKGVENVYTQHQPLLFQTIESIVKGRLRDIDYPFVGNHFQQGRPQDVVIFIVGGSTYEEARTVALQNAANNGTRVILGGSVILNSTSFLQDLEDAQRVGRTSVV